MTKRYAFWRAPDGRPYKTEDGKYSPTALLSEICKAASIKDNAISWGGFEHIRFKSAIQNVIVILDQNNDELNSNDTRNIFSSALNIAIKKQSTKGSISADELLKEVDNESAAFFRMPETKYVLVSSLSIVSFPAKQIKIGGCVIMPLDDRRDRYPFPDCIMNRASQAAIDKHVAGTKYQIVLIKTQGRSIQEASHKALQAVDLLRGLWTLFATYQSWSCTLGGIRKTKPLGAIYRGPVHTLHNLDGTLVGDICWYDPGFIEDQDLYKPGKEWDNIEKHRRWAIRLIGKLPYKCEIEEIIIRYVNSLDHLDLHRTFIHLWGLLEKMTDTIGGDYDKTINRAAWIFGERQIVKEMLRSLRLNRNLLIHSACASGEPDQISYMVKSIIDPHIIRLIRNDFRVDSLEDYGKFLSLPTSLDALEKQRKMLSHAVKTAKKWNKKALVK